MTYISEKKYLIIALLEDILLLTFIATLLLSILEVLLPGIVTSNIPLAFIFTFLVGVAYLYFSLLEKNKYFVKQGTLPKIFLLSLFILFGFVTLLMNQNFGLFGAVVQVLFLGLMVVVLWKKN